MHYSLKSQISGRTSILTFTQRQSLDMYWTCRNDGKREFMLWGGVHYRQVKKDWEEWKYKEREDRNRWWEMERGSNLGGLCGPQLDWSRLNEVPQGQKDWMVQSWQCTLPVRWTSTLTDSHTHTHTLPRNVLPLCLILTITTSRLFSIGTLEPYYLRIIVQE